MRLIVIFGLVITLGLFSAGCGGGSGGGGAGLTSPSATNGDFPSGGSADDGQDDGGGSPPGELTFRVLDADVGSAITVAELAVARDPVEYSQLWARHHPPMPPGVGAPDIGPPAVDFATEIVVGIFLGQRLTGGYTVNVLTVEAAGDGANVVWEERQPGPNCAVSTAMTTPFALVAIERVSGAVTFDGSVRVVTCP